MKYINSIKIDNVLNSFTIKDLLQLPFPEYFKDSDSFDSLFNKILRKTIMILYRINYGAYKKLNIYLNIKDIFITENTIILKENYRGKYLIESQISLDVNAVCIAIIGIKKFEDDDMHEFNLRLGVFLNKEYIPILFPFYDFNDFIEHIIKNNHYS